MVLDSTVEQLLRLLVPATPLIAIIIVIIIIIIISLR